MHVKNVQDTKDVPNVDIVPKHSKVHTYLMVVVSGKSAGEEGCVVAAWQVLQHLLEFIVFFSSLVMRKETSSVVDFVDELEEMVACVVQDHTYCTQRYN